MNPWPAYAIRDYSRIGSILLNDTRSDLIFVTKDLLNFQHGADAIVLACQTDEGYFNVRLIDFGETSFQSAPLMDPCPEN